MISLITARYHDSLSLNVVQELQYQASQIIWLRQPLEVVFRVERTPMDSAIFSPVDKPRTLTQGET
jgi:hypothetical protein